MSPIRRIVMSRRSLFFVFTACAVALLIWRPWQSRSTVNAAALLTTTMVGESAPPAGESVPILEPLDEPGIAPQLDPPPKPTILGSWRDDFYGKRIFHFRDDGTAVMTIELDSVGQLLYGPKLKFFVAWELDGDILKLKMTGGEPKSAYSAAKIFGESSEQRIESLEASEMKLRSLDSNKLYLHRRVDEMP